MGPNEALALLKARSAFFRKVSIALFVRSGKKGTLGVYDMKAHISRLLGFLSLRNDQMIEPTTVWAAVSPHYSASTKYSFLKLIAMGRRALLANSGEGWAQ